MEMIQLAAHAWTAYAAGAVIAKQASVGTAIAGTDAIGQALTVQEQFNTAMLAGQKAAQGLKSSLKGVFNPQQIADWGKQVAQMAITGAAEEDTMRRYFIAKTGNEKQGSSMYEKFRADALQSGQPLTESLTGTLAFMNRTQDVGALEQLNDFSNRLAALDPSRSGYKAAASAVQAALGGDTSVLASTFNLSEDRLEQYNIGALGEEAAATGNMDAFLQKFDELLEASGMGEEAYSMMLAGPAKQADMLKQNVQAALAEAGRNAVAILLPAMTMLNDAFENGKMDAFIYGLSNALSVAAWLFTTLAKGALWVSEVVATYWPEVLGMLGALAAIYLPTIIGFLWGMVSPIIATAGAWLLAHWPILATVAAVGLIIYTLRAMGVTAEQMIGAIVGSFYFLLAAINNSIASMWNRFIAIAEFFANVFSDPVFAVKNLFYNLAMNFGQFMYNMILSAEQFGGAFRQVAFDAVNGAIKAFNWLSDAVEAVFGKGFGTMELLESTDVHAASNKVKEWMNHLEKPTSDAEGLVDLSRYAMQQKSLSDSFNKGYEVGADLAMQAGAMEPVSLLGGGDKKGYSADTSEQWSSGGGAALAYGAPTPANDNVDLPEENLVMMRDMAERESVRSFVTLTPTVQVTTGNIMQEVDVNTVIARIEAAMEQEIAMSAERVML